MNVPRSGCAILCIYLIIFDQAVIVKSNDFQNDTPKIQYSSAILRGLHPAGKQTNNALVSAIPPEIRRRKRGRKGGVRARYRRKLDRPPLPALVTGNARSLNNKLDELCANIRFLNEYRESALICFSETWFYPDSFSLYRCDRTKDSNKACGGGVCAYINKS